MTRSTWIAVLVTAGLLALAGAVPRAFTTGRAAPRATPAHAATARHTEPSHSAAGTAAARTAAWRHAREGLEAWWTLAALSASVRAGETWRAARAASPAAAPAAAAGALVLAAVAMAVRARRNGRVPARRVLVLARAGRSHADIARECGLPQDAVRALLRPRAMAPRTRGR